MTEDNNQVLDISMRESKDGYIGMIMGHFSRMASIVASGGDSTNKHADLYYMTNLIISMIPKLEKQKDIRNKLKLRIEELKKEGKSESAAISNASVELIGDCVIYLDESLGVNKENRISIDFDCGGCKYKKLVKELLPERVKECL
jgi:hypothetical protein